MKRENRPLFVGALCLIISVALTLFVIFYVDR